MGRKEMYEIAAIIKFILFSTKASINEKTGEPSKAKYDISESSVDKAKNMVKELLGRYPVYPELDLEFLMEHFV
jgi:glycine hydroxymethyltransferase